MAGGVEHPILLSEVLGIAEAHKHIFYTWMAIIVIAALGFCVRKTKLVPTGMQNVLESLIGGLEDYTVLTIGEQGRSVYPYLGGIFIFIVVQNLLGLIPACDAPTANINTTAAMAITTFIYYHWVGIKTWGFKYINHFLGPMLPLAPLMLILEIISHCARPLSLTLRLFGNIRGEEIVLVMFFAIAPVATTLPVYALFLLAKVLQGFIFYMLTMLYLKGSLEHAH